MAELTVIMQDYFARSFGAVAVAINKTARQHGFWESNNRAEKIALMHSELGEATEALRHGNPMSKTIKGFTHVEEELADCLIRMMDFAVEFKYNIADAVLAKMKYNEGRKFKHGKKF